MKTPSVCFLLTWTVLVLAACTSADPTLVPSTSAQAPVVPESRSRLVAPVSANPSVTPPQTNVGFGTADKLTITPIVIASSLTAPCSDEPWLPTHGMAQDLQPRDVDPDSGRWVMTSESGGVYLFESGEEGLPGKWISRFCPGEGLPNGKIVDAVFGPSDNTISVAMASRGLGQIDLSTGKATPVSSLPEVTVARCLRWPEKPGQILLLFAPMGPAGDFGGLVWFDGQGTVSTPKLTIPGSPGIHAYRIVDAVWLASTNSLLLASTAGLLQLDTDGKTQQWTQNQVAALDMAVDRSHGWAAGGDLVRIDPQGGVTKLLPLPGPPKHRPAIRDVITLDDGYVVVNVNGTVTRGWTNGAQLVNEHTVNTIEDARTIRRVGNTTSVVVGTWKRGLYHVTWPPYHTRQIRQ
ncbi:MAG: hypothetical protein HUU55_17800 [Myxococcales bacterium]|nr:hypothetical protein [Myxococcales bacterium]